jgi:hypothetical protein
MASRSPSKPADAPCSGQAVEVRKYRYTPGCRCLACATRRAFWRRRGFKMPEGADWRATPHPSTSNSERRGEE